MGDSFLLRAVFLQSLRYDHSLFIPIILPDKKYLEGKDDGLIIKSESTVAVSHPKPQRGLELVDRYRNRYYGIIPSLVVQSIWSTQSTTKLAIERTRRLF